jgi:diphthine-ammonia ligase
MTQVFASWSGGKDCCLAVHRAAKQGLQVSYLLNMLNQDGERSCFHGVRADLLRAQSEALEIPILQRTTAMGSYEEEFKAAIRELCKAGVEGGVFGDIDMGEHREWVERVCQEAGVQAFLPLWHADQAQLLKEFITSGFEAIVVATRAGLFAEEWIGASVDSEFAEHLLALQAEAGSSVCGEAGEYHTLVLNGPIFVRRIEITRVRTVKRGNYHFLDVLGYELKAKPDGQTRGRGS